MFPMQTKSTPMGRGELIGGEESVVIGNGIAQVLRVVKLCKEISHAVQAVAATPMAERAMSHVRRRNSGSDGDCDALRD